MNLQPYYVAITDFAECGIGHACDPVSFDDACDAYADQMDAGRETLVFYVEPPKGDAAGIMIDVTVDATACISRRVRQRGHDFPDWLLEAEGREVAA